jgi:protein involved in polysaccharide export with SLBB domain
VKIVRNKSFIRATICGIIILSVIVLSGCDSNNRILEPHQVGRFRPVPAVNVILDSLGVEEETPPAYADAEDPLPEDGVAEEGDYTFAPGDAVRVSIFELFTENTPYTDDFFVDESGRINIVQVGVVDVLGLTERQLEDEIRSILQPKILKNPLVNVTLMRSQRLNFSIAGAGVKTAGRFAIPRYEFRLLDALALAGGMSQFNMSYIYVSRPVKNVQTTSSVVLPQEDQVEKSDTAAQQMLEMITPAQKQQHQTTDKRTIITSAEMATEAEQAKTSSSENLDLLNQIVGLQEKSTDQTGKVEWIFKDGKYIAVPVGEKAKPQETAEQPKTSMPEQSAAAYRGEQAATQSPKARLIKIPADKLASGDPKYNIVIRGDDVIQAPIDMIGEFCVTGNVRSAAGFYALTGRPLTLKMAIAAAGGLTPMAYPKHCEITRRIGKDREETVMVDFDKICRGEQPDFFIKPNDLINVGTHPTSVWRYQLQNAFRASYGFGTVYDRNFAQQTYGTTTDRHFGLNDPLGPLGF